MDICKKYTYKGYTIRETDSQGWQVGLFGQHLGWFVTESAALEFIDKHSA
jgi:hypothetical protein